MLLRMLEVHMLLVRMQNDAVTVENTELSYNPETPFYLIELKTGVRTKT